MTTANEKSGDTVLVSFCAADGTVLGEGVVDRDRLPGEIVIRRMGTISRFCMIAGVGVFDIPVVRSVSEHARMCALNDVHVQRGDVIFLHSLSIFESDVP